jgi:DNA-binding transcriptional LysR family regulator
LKVGVDLSVPSHSDIFAVGDTAAGTDQPGIPGTAPPAKLMGRYADRLIAARVAGAPSPPPFVTLIALAAGGHGIAVVPQGVLIPRAKVHAVPLVHRGVPIGRWQTVAWDSQRFLAPYAHQFIAELVAYSRRNYPNCHLTGRAPLMPRPKEPTS